MRVLWLCNIMLPVIADSLGLPASNKEGWLSGLAKWICKEPSAEQEDGITLGVCFPAQKALQGEAAGISYYGFAEDTMHPERYDKVLEERLKYITEDFKPDIVHCFGTEYPHTLAMTRAFSKPQRTLIGIQGLCFVYADAYMADLPQRICKRTLLRDFLKRDNLIMQQKKYRMRGEYEKEALRGACHVTGRTDWDRYFTKLINPAASYHFMNETLRAPFYGARWLGEACEPYSIFVSQGNYPIKGLHYLLQALPEVLLKYKEAHVYVAGDKITAYTTLKEKLKISNYGKYLLELLHQNQLEDKVTFLGRLNTEKMLERYLKSQVFLSPSAIENSPNSVGEAMLLGMPVISSDVGGVHNMLKNEEEGLLYKADDIHALAECICRVFSTQGYLKAVKMGEHARAHALETHDGEKNSRRLLEIYHEINLCI